MQNINIPVHKLNLLLLKATECEETDSDYHPFWDSETIISGTNPKLDEASLLWC